MELDSRDRKLLTLLQGQFPLTPRPFQALAQVVDLSEGEAMARLQAIKASGVLRQVCGIFDSHRLGYQSTLVAMKLVPQELDRAAAHISQHPGVSHNYSRDHVFNLWFTLTLPPEADLPRAVQELSQRVGASRTLNLPALRVFKIGVHFDLTGDEAPPPGPRQPQDGVFRPLSTQEKTAVKALQQDLPLVSRRPFQALARPVGLEEANLLSFARAFLEQGVMRRFGALLRHQQAGFVANGMGVWAVPEEKVEEAGQAMASFPAVSHCYQRPTYPDWPYSLFTMAHGRSHAECQAVIEEIARRVSIRDYLVLFSLKEYKKERVKYFV